LPKHEGWIVKTRRHCPDGSAPASSARAAVPPVPAGLIVALLAAGAVLAGCGSGEPRGRVEALPDPGLAFLAEAPRRRAGCVPVAETAFTRPFFETGADLVACRAGHSPGVALVAERGARQVGRTANWTLFSVPRPPSG
jgi:hypothetical protein